MSVLVQLRPTAPEAPAVQELLTLARDRSTEARERLLMGVLSLCDAHPPVGEVSPVLGEIFLTLARQAEREVRRALSLRLAEVDWAPHELITVLASDEIEVARPVLNGSPLLQDDDLLRILVEATLEHQIAVARRPNLGGRVADAIIDRGEPATLIALASNRSAQISLDGVRRLVEHSRRVAALRSPLARHPGLTEQLAEQMYVWVGAALRESICCRFSVDPAKMAAVIAQATNDALSNRDYRPETVVPDTDRDEMERRLVDKLQAAGQLKAGYLVRAVRERRLGLFVHGLSALSGFPAAHVRQSLNADTPEGLFYACAAVGIDRSVFPALLTEIRLLNGGHPGDGGDRVWRRGDVSESSAARAFRAIYTN